MTCSTYRRITTNKEENTGKWQKRGPQRAKNPNFEKKNCCFFSCPKEYYAKKLDSYVKNSDLQHANRQTDINRHTEVLVPEDTIRASVFQASASGMSGPIGILLVVTRLVCGHCIQGPLKKGPQRDKNRNFEKQKIDFFSHVPRSTMPKNYIPKLKTVTCILRTDRQTHTQMF